MHEFSQPHLVGSSVLMKEVSDTYNFKAFDVLVCECTMKSNIYYPYILTSIFKKLLQHLLPRNVLKLCQQMWPFFQAARP